MAELTNGQSQKVNNGQTVYDTVVNDYFSYQSVLGGGKAFRTTVNKGKLYVEADGYTSGAVINGKSAFMYVSANGSAQNLTAKNSATVNISAGGKVTNANFDQTCTLNIDVTSNTILTGTSNGKNVLVSNGITSNIPLINGCNMKLGSGWSTYDTTIDDYFSYQSVLGGGKAFRTTVKMGKLYVEADGYTSGAVINGKSAFMYVSANGSAQNLTAKNSATVNISAGGKVKNANFDATCTLNIDVTSNTILTGTSNGKNVLVSNGITSNITLINGCYMKLGSGWSTYDTTIDDYFSYQSVLGGGKAFRTTVKMGKLYVEADGYTNGAVINGKSAFMYVSANGSAENLTGKNSATVNISAGGKVTNANFDQTCTLNIDVTSNTILTGTSNGKNVLVSNGITSNITLINGCYMKLGSGWSTYDTTIDDYFSYQSVLGGGKAFRTTVKMGKLYVEADGYASGAVINGKSAFMYISGNGLANNVTVKNGAKMYIRNNGTLAGSATFNMGSAIVDKGGIVDFTVKDQDASDGYLINDLSAITGTPTYTITVSDKQESGTYKLAQGANGFNHTITVKLNDTELGQMKVGQSFQIGTATYKLNLNSGDLTLAVTGGYCAPTGQPAFIVGKFNGKGGAFNLTADGTATIHSTSGKITVAGKIDTTQWELLGAGDFNKNGNDGLLWLEKETGYVYMQNDLSNFNEVLYKTNCLGIVGEGYEIRGIGDFTGTGIEGVVMKGPAFGDASVSLNYGLPIWGRENDGSTFNGWLGALVNTWQPGAPLKGSPFNLASINANNYMYEIVDVGDYNGDGVDDVMLQNIMPKTVNGVTITGSGDVFTFLTGDINAVKAGASPTVVYAGCATDGWEIIGSGDFNGDGIDDTLLSDGSGVAGWAMYNGQRYANQWFGSLGATEEIAGIADFNNDGTDDILVKNTATDEMSVWLVKNGETLISTAIA